MKPVWQQVIDRLPQEVKLRHLAQITRGRRRFFPISLNGYVYHVARALVRNYLKETT